MSTVKTYIPLRCLTSVFSTLTSNVPLHCLHFLRAASLFVNGNPGSGFLSVRTHFFLYPSLWNRSPSLLLLSSYFRLCDAELSRRILEKKLVGSGLLDVLRECLDLSLLLRSLASRVLDSECCDTSWIFEFFPKHPSKTASDAGLSGFFEVCSLSLPTVFRTTNVGGVRLSSAGPLMDDLLRNESKLLALPWRKASRLDSGVRVRNHIVRSMCVYLEKSENYTFCGRSGTLVGQGSAVIMLAVMGFLPQAEANPRMTSGSGLRSSTSVLLYPGRGPYDTELNSSLLCLSFVYLGRGPSLMVQPRPRILLYPLYVIRDCQPYSTAYSFMSWD
ncbi:hypothetical protein Tco_1074337 [Tanacetum coccineum]